MPEILIRPQAEVDIEAIANYTINRWGKIQARSYIDALRRDIIGLSQFPERFPLHPGTGLNLRRMKSGHHLVFYMVGDSQIEIVRIPA